MNASRLLWIAVVACSHVSLSLAQSGDSPVDPAPAEPAAVQPGTQAGRTQPPAAVAGSPGALAMWEAAQHAIEASEAFDRGDMARGRARTLEAIRAIESAEAGLNKPGRERDRSKLAEQRGRLQLEFLGDEAAAMEAFETALEAADNPVARRRIEELSERAAARQTGNPGN